MNLPLLPGLTEPPRQSLEDGVARAMALLWTYHSRRVIADALRELGYRRGDRRDHTQAEIKQAMDVLDAQGQLVKMPDREGYFRLRDELRAKLYRELIEHHVPEDLRGALLRAVNYRPDGRQYYWSIRDLSSAVAITRVALYTAMPHAEFEILRREISHVADWPTVISEAALAAFDGASFERLQETARWDIADWALSLMNRAWNPRVLPVVEWLLATVRPNKTQVPDDVLLNLAEVMVHRGDHKRATALLASQTSGAAQALRACILVQQSRWAQAQAAFQAAIECAQTETSSRKQLFPISIAWYYPLALIAQRTPQHLAAARKFCLGEAGSRDPSPFDGWGLWVHAVQSHLGEVALKRKAFDVSDRTSRHVRLDALWCVLLAAWLGREALGLAQKHDAVSFDRLLTAMKERLKACRFAWLIGQLESAQAELEGREPAKGFFVGERSER